jgi:hypothetical protein
MNSPSCQYLIQTSRKFEEIIKHASIKSITQESEDYPEKLISDKLLDTNVKSSSVATLESIIMQEKLYISSR